MNKEQCLIRQLKEGQDNLHKLLDKLRNNDPGTIRLLYNGHIPNTFYNFISIIIPLNLIFNIFNNSFITENLTLIYVAEIR